MLARHFRCRKLQLVFILGCVSQAQSIIRHRGRIAAEDSVKMRATIFALRPFIPLRPTLPLASAASAVTVDGDASHTISLRVFDLYLLGLMMISRLMIVRCARRRGVHEAIRRQVDFQARLHLYGHDDAAFDYFYFHAAAGFISAAAVDDAFARPDELTARRGRASFITAFSIIRCCSIKKISRAAPPRHGRHFTSPPDDGMISLLPFDDFGWLRRRHATLTRRHIGHISLLRTVSRFSRRAYIATFYDFLTGERHDARCDFR